MTDTQVQRSESKEQTIEEVWEGFWLPIVLKEGQISLDEIKRELYDYALVLDQVRKVYSHITGGVITNQTSFAFDVIRVHDQLWTLKDVD